MEKFKAKDILALLVIVALVIFKVTGHNGDLDVAVAIIIGYYFARREDKPVMVRKEEIATI